MEQYVAGGVLAAISQRHSSKQKPSTKKHEPKDSFGAADKKSQLICNSPVKKHIKREITSGLAEKIPKEKNGLGESRDKKSHPFQQPIPSDGAKSIGPTKCGKKRKLASNEAAKTGVGETDQINANKSKFRKVMEDNQSQKNSCDAFSSKHSPRGDVKNKQMKKLIKNNENVNSAERDNRTIYVGNLPLKYDHKKVVKFFSKFGKIENARIRCVPIPSFGFPKRKAAITKKFNANRNSVSAYVVFKNEESVSKAVELNGIVLDEHHIRIDKAVPQKKDLKKSVFVGNLPFDVEDDELWDFFKDCGEIDSVRIVRDDKFSMGKGFGYVNFKSSASVELALALDSHEIKNRKINVQRCILKKKKESFKKSPPLKSEKRIKKQRHQKKFFPKCEKSSSKHDFQGREAEHKQKKKKRKLTKDAARKSKIMSALKLSLKKKKNGSSKSDN